MVKPVRIEKYVRRYLEVLNALSSKMPTETRSILPDHVMAKQEVRIYLTSRTGVAIDYIGIASKPKIDFRMSPLSFDDLIFPPTDPIVPVDIGALQLKPIKSGLPSEPTRTIKLMGSMAGIVLLRTDNEHLFAWNTKEMIANQGRYTFFNLYVQRVYRDGRIRSKFVRYAELYPDRDEFFSLSNAEKNAAKHFDDYLKFLVSPDMAPSPQKYLKIGEVVQQLKQNSVAVLGKDSPPEADLLRRIRDELGTLNYRAFLVREENSLSGQTPEEKVKLLTLMSKFCVMEDSTASGHIVEFEYCKTNRVVLVLLRKKGHGSTWMIGDAELVDLNFIKTFSYDDNNLREVLVEATTWAEFFIKRREEAYKAYFP